MVTQLGPSPGIAARHPVNVAPPPLRGGVPLSQLEGGGPRGCPPRDGCLELNPLRFHYRLQSPEPWLLSRGAEHGEMLGGGKG